MGKPNFPTRQPKEKSYEYKNQIEGRISEVKDKVEDTE